MKKHRTLMVLVTAALSVVCLSASLPQDKQRRARPMESRISLITLGVADLERSFRFYRDGLGLPTQMTPEKGIVVFATSGTRLALYPYEKLAEDVGCKPSARDKGKPAFSGVTLGHCARSREEVDRLLALAQEAGGKIVKKAQNTSWGGYSGYFTDPDGYPWEVAYSDLWKFNPDGSVALP
jgi:hypothetical protein